MSAATSVSHQPDMDASVLSWRGWTLALLAAVLLHASPIAYALWNPVELASEDEAAGFAAPLDIEMIAAAPDDIATKTGQAQPEVAPQLSSPTETPVTPPAQTGKNDVDIEQKSLSKSEVAMAAPSKTENLDKSEAEQDSPPTPPQPQMTAAAAAQEQASMPSIAAPKVAEAKTTSLGLSPSARKSKATWQKRLAVHIDGFKQYPEAARSHAGTGEVLVSFTIDRSGALVSRRLLQGSGNAALDEEAVAMLVRAAPLPVPPSDVPGITFEMAIPIRFKLPMRSFGFNERHSN
ncbi:MAG: TonB family protein [Hyphomicrobiaceae bacterium]